MNQSDLEHTRAMLERLLPESWYILVAIDRGENGLNVPAAVLSNMTSEKALRQTLHELADKITSVSNIYRSEET